MTHNCGIGTRRIERRKAMQQLRTSKVIDMLTRNPVISQGTGFHNEDIAQRIIHKLRRLERLDEYALDATDVYLSGMLDVLDR